MSVNNPATSVGTYELDSTVCRHCEKPLHYVHQCDEPSYDLTEDQILRVREIVREEIEKSTELRKLIIRNTLLK